MSSKIKALGLALVAAFAMSALAASAAQAQNPADLQCGPEPVEEFCTITAEADPEDTTQLFKTSVGNISCDEFHAIGTPPHGEPFSELTLTEVEYNKCTLAGLFASVDFDDCHYTLHSGETVEPGKATGSVDVSETPESPCSITIEAFGCTVTVEPQENLESITATEKTQGETEVITGEANVEGIAYSWTGFKCGSGEAENGVYEGNFIARAYAEDDETPTDLTIVDTEA